MLSVTINPGTLTDAAGAKPNTGYGVVTLNTPAPTGGLTVDLTEAIGGTTTTDLTLSSTTLTFAAGQLLPRSK